MAEAGDSCKIESRRQDAFMAIGKGIRPSNGPQTNPSSVPDLPVVELKPFVQKEWRRAKSLPNYWDTKMLRLAAQDNAAAAAAAMAVHKMEFIAQRELMSNMLGSISGSPTHREKEKSFVYEEEESEEKSLNSARSSNLSPRGYSSPRACTKDMFQKLPKFGFATKPDREKTTLSEIQTGKSENISYSFLKKSMSEEDTAKQQMIRLSGRRVRPGITFKSLPASLYNYQRSYTMPPTSMTNDLDYIARSLYGGSTPMTVREYSKSMPEYPHTPYTYDGNYSRTQTLPLIEIRNTPLKLRKKIQQQQQFYKQHRRNVQQRNPDYDAYRTGGIQNTLQVMNETGRPLGIEQQLTMEMKSTLEQLRKNKTTYPPPPSIAGSVRAGQPRFTSGVPTPGEMMLIEGQKSNQKKSRAELEAISTSRDPHVQNDNNDLGNDGQESRTKVDNHDSGIQSPVDGHDDHHLAHAQIISNDLLGARLEELVVEDTQKADDLDIDINPVDEDDGDPGGGGDRAVSAAKSHVTSKTFITNKDTPANTPRPASSSTDLPIELS